MWSVRKSPSDTRANHTGSEPDINRSLVRLVTQFQPQLAVEPLKAVGLTRAGLTHLDKFRDPDYLGRPGPLVSYPQAIG